jgi:TetR/AcrR family transcriptional repressor of nem operon
MATKGEQTREKILAAARLVFKRKGFAATTINDLLDAAGTTKGNLYFHFADKEAIGLAVLKREQQLFYQFLDRVFAEATPAQGLDHFFRQVLEKQSQQGFIGGCLFGNMALEASDTSPVFTRLVQEVFNEWNARLEQHIRLAQRDRQIRTDIPAGDLAELVVAAIEGGIMQSRLHKSESPLKRSLNVLRRVLEIKI